MVYFPNQRLGTGSYNTVVFRGRFNRRSVAIKRLLISSPDEHKRISQELELHKNSDSHGNIVRLYNYETVKSLETDLDILYMALELCTTTLDQWVLNSQGIAVQDRVQILHQISNGLCHLHDIRIVHRDIKPSNILLLIEKSKITVKIADFGISREIPDGSTHVTLSTKSGTTEWMAPEIRTGEDKMVVILCNQ